MPDGPISLAVHEWPPESGASRAASAPVAMLVHGVTGWHRTWWRVGPAMAARGWRVLAVDQRGHGTSPRIGDAASIDDLAADLGRAIDEHAGGAVDLLVGHSLGAVVAMWLAHRRPTAARRLVLEDPPSLDRAGDVEFLARLRSEIEAARADAEGEIRRERAEHPRWADGDARQNVEGRALADADGIVALLDRPRGFAVPELAAEMTIPTLYLLGAEEQGSVLVGAARERLRATLPTSARLEILDAGHTIHRDRFEEYVAALLDWSGRDA
jgi:pimeloyl-ACP methyl ester carboxylesterase